MGEKNEFKRLKRSDIYHEDNMRKDMEDTIDKTIQAEELHQRKSLTTKPGDQIENPFTTT